MIITKLNGPVLTPDRIKKLRENANMTQAELARRLGITRSSVNGWEMGLVLPSTAMLVEMSKLFHVSTDYLLGLDIADTISTDGLTEREVTVIRETIDCFLARGHKSRQQ